MEEEEEKGRGPAVEEEECPMTTESGPAAVTLARALGVSLVVAARPRDKEGATRGRAHRRRRRTARLVGGKGAAATSTRAEEEEEQRSRTGARMRAPVGVSMPAACERREREGPRVEFRRMALAVLGSGWEWGDKERRKKKQK